MNTAQKVIKYFAVALAAGIIVLIFSAMAGVGMILSRITGTGAGRTETVGTTEVEELREWEVGEEPRDLEIEVATAGVRIETGERFAIEVSEAKIEQSGNERHLKIREQEDGWPWGWDEQSEVVIYVPEDAEFGKVKLETGLGTVEIAALKAEEVDLELGAGKTTIGRLKATRKAKIEGGMGLLEIREGELHDLDLDMGAGKVVVRAKLRGKAKVDAGIGEMNLRLVGAENDYRVLVDQGIGGVSWHGLGENNPHGENLVEINGGLGAMNFYLEN